MAAQTELPHQLLRSPHFCFLSSHIPSTSPSRPHTPYFQAPPDVWIHYVYQNLSNKRAASLHKSSRSRHGATRRVEINTAPSFDTYMKHIHTNLQARACFTGSRAKPQHGKTRERGELYRSRNSARGDRQWRRTCTCFCTDVTTATMGFHIWLAVNTLLQMQSNRRGREIEREWGRAIEKKRKEW